MSSQQIDLLLITFVLAFGVPGFFFLRAIVRRSRAREYARLRPVIDGLGDYELVRAVSSGRYEYHADLSEYANKEVVSRGLTLVQLDTEAFNAWSNDLRKYRFRLPWLGVARLFMLILAFFSFIWIKGVFVLVAIIEVGEKWAPLVESLLNIVLTILLVNLIYRFLVVLRRMRTVSALKSLVERPRERPVVYLRSFAQETEGSTIIGRVTEEEQLAMAFDMLGPFVAIGRPGERLPQVGAARLYVKGDMWQEVVAELMSKAQLLVLRIGGTEGFWWEFKKTIGEVAPERVLLLVPNDKRVYTNFRLKANELLPTQLPEHLEGLSYKNSLGEWLRWILLKVFPAIGHTGSLKGIIHFDPDWTPHFVKLGLTLRGEVNSPGYAAFAIALQPTLKKLTTALYVPTISVFRCVTLGFAIINIVGGFAMVIASL